MYMKNILYGVLIAALVFTFLGLYAFLRYGQMQSKKIDSTAVIMKVRALSRLETASFTIERIIDIKESTGTKLTDVLFGDSILLIAQGEVVAGIDLSKLTEKDITIEDKKITLRLPAPEILTSRLDSEKTRVYDRRQGLFTKGDKNIESKARSQAEASIRKAACDGKILDQAYENAKKQIRTLLLALGYEEVEITSSATFPCGS